jgi:ectoine hydroxylase-related dioxygenase (phytanoyl-CoA dioxygenase family)
VQEAGGVPGSAAWLERFADWHPWLAELMGRKSVPTRTSEEWLGTAVDVHGTVVQVVELTGEPGDAVLCHPMILHAASPNCRPTPRMMRRTNFRRRR